MSFNAFFNELKFNMVVPEVRELLYYLSKKKYINLNFQLKKHFVIILKKQTLCVFFLFLRNARQQINLFEFLLVGEMDVNMIRFWIATEDCKSKRE